MAFFRASFMQEVGPYMILTGGIDMDVERMGKGMVF